MLTHKQLWRRTNSEKSTKKSLIDALIDCGSKSSTDTDIFLRTNSAPCFSHAKPPIIDHSSSLNDISMKKASNRNPNHVRFSKATQVVLVPTRKEFIDHGLQDSLWWQHSDYAKFKASLLIEYQALSQDQPTPQTFLKDLQNDLDTKSNLHINIKELQKDVETETDLNINMEDLIKFYVTKPKLIAQSHVSQKKRVISMEGSSLHPLGLMAS